jgi:uncharacterized protein (TIGR02246 family)
MHSPSPRCPRDLFPLGRAGCLRGFRLPMVLIAAACWSAVSVTAADRSADEAAIRAAAAAYMEALDKGDADKLLALWVPGGDIVDAAGNVLSGPEAVGLAKQSAAAGDRPEFQLRETKLRFLTPDVAIEDGTVEVIPPTGAAVRGRFSATWVRHEGGWKLAALREARAAEPTAAEALADLDWMVGDWVVIHADGEKPKPGEPVIEVTAGWNESKTFLTRVMTITHSKDAPPLRITQRIGWDPLSKSINSRAFGSDGSHGEADWNRDGRSWVAQARAVLPDGGQSTSLNIYSYDGKDRCVWRSLPTHVGAEHVPPVNMTMIRKPKAASGQEGNR